MPRNNRSRVLYLRTFRGAKSDNDMVVGLMEVLSGLAKLVVMGPAEAEVSLKRYWSRRYSDPVGPGDRLDYVVCTNDSWRRDVHWQISKASCVLFYLSAKSGSFPAHRPPRMRNDFDDFYSAPLAKGSSGQGLLQEIAYLRRLNKIPLTVLMCRHGDRQLIDRMINLPMIGDDSGPVAGGYMFRSSADGLQAMTARFSAFDKQIISLQNSHGVIEFDTRELVRLPEQSRFARL